MSWRMLLILSPLALVGIDLRESADLPSLSAHSSTLAVHQASALTDRQLRAMRERDRLLTAQERADLALLQAHYAEQLGLDLPPAAENEHPR